MGSEKTAMHRTSLSAPVKWLLEKGYLITGNSVLDFGCGHGRDVLELRKLGFYADGYDPHWKPAEDLLLKQYNTVLCTYVLNVVEEQEEIEILRKLEKLGKVIFITVRRDLPKLGLPGKDCWQRWVDLPQGYRSIRKTASFEVFQKIT